MRVLLINQTFVPDPQATSQYLSDWAEDLAARGHEVTVLTSRRAYADPRVLYPAEEEWRGVRIVRVWNSGLGHGAKWKRAVDFATFLVSASLRGLFLRADAIVALTTPPLVSALGATLALLRRARFVYWVMDLNPDEAVAVGWLRPDGLATRFLEAVSRWTLRRASRIIALDVYMKERLAAKGIAPEKIEVVPLWMQAGVAFDFNGREEFRRDHGWTDRYVVMYSGNHTPCHPLDTLVEAARLTQDDPRLLYVFAGGGTEWKRLRARAGAEGWPNVEFLGYQPLEHLSASLSAADTQVVALGDPFVGIVHPCKIYNFLTTRRPFVYLGPSPSHVTDLVRDAGLQAQAALFRHGEDGALAQELRRRARGASPGWPADLAPFLAWEPEPLLEKMAAALA